MAGLDQLVFDCAHPARLARFWAAVLDGYAVRAYDDAEIARLAARGLTPETDDVVMVDGPGPTLCFQLAREPRPEKGRLHPDVSVRDPPREVERLRALGATLEREAGVYTVLLDPEGNAFCVVQR